MKIRFVVALSLILSLQGCTSSRPAIQWHPPSEEATIRLLEEQERLGVLNRDTVVFWEAEGPGNPLPQRYMRNDP